MTATTDNPEERIVICGAGLAGLTLARQLKLRWPELPVLVLDRLERPLPEAAFKVGESTVEVGASYLADVLDLRDYFDQCHLPKLGLRFFFGDAAGPFAARPEFGISRFPEVSSYQIDRGLLENDLRRLVAEAGVELLEGCHVRDIRLAGDGGLHEVVYRRADGEAEAARGRWVIDAMGRRRLLQRKLGLTREPTVRHDAVWFRIDGRVDVDDLVAESDREWHRRVPNRNRYFSTNHLMGHGYWVWIIPLSTGHTSVGIVTHGGLHDFGEINTWERARAWLGVHEPVFAAYLDRWQPVDFRRLGNYTYSSRQVLSVDRWASIGEAGVFADPFYSPGTDLIGFTNCALTDLIAADREGSLTPQAVERANLLVLGLNGGYTRRIQPGYPFFGHAAVMAAKLIWDTASAWALNAPAMFNQTFLDRELDADLRRITRRQYKTAERVQALFADWARRPGRLDFDYFDYLSLPFLSELRRRNLQTGKSREELVADHEASMELLEELAQAIFLLAVEDTMPERLGELPEPRWLEVRALSLDPERWHAEGLFAPRTPRRDLDRVLAPLRAFFHPHHRELAMAA